MTIVDNNNCIPSGLRADIMRQSMENKNLLSTKGSIYVGTGESVTINGEKIYKTKALALGAEGEILQVKNGDLGYGKIPNTLFSDKVDYSGVLKTTFNSFPVTRDWLSGKFSYLRIGKDNFSPDEDYSNIIGFDTSEVSIGRGSKISFTGSAGSWGLKCIRRLLPLVRWKITFSFDSDPPLYFDYIESGDNFDRSSNTMLFNYCKRYGQILSGSSSWEWTGWAIPSSSSDAVIYIEGKETYETVVYVNLKKYNDSGTLQDIPYNSREVTHFQAF